MPHVRRRTAAALGVTLIAVTLIAAVVMVATPLWGRWTPFSPPPSDTTVVYGPHRFSTPTGRSTIGVEKFTLSPQPLRLYLLKLANGNPDGSSRASKATVVLNGQTVITAADLGGAYSATRVVQAFRT